MTTEKHDPWALLREAREALYADRGLMRDSLKCDCRTCSLIKAIDAALAEVERPTSERDTAKRHLSELLARIHRDGGQYEASIGTAAAVEEADFIVSGLLGRADERADDFRRGVAAMREAAARECWKASDVLADIPDMTEQQGEIQILARRIRALPDPEDLLARGQP